MVDWKVLTEMKYNLICSDIKSILQLLDASENERIEFTKMMIEMDMDKVDDKTKIQNIMSFLNDLVQD